MSRGGPYSRRHRTWPYRHAGGGHGKRKSRHGHLAQLSGQKETSGRALLLARARKEANRAAREAAENAACQRRTAARRLALRSWISFSNPTRAELNLIKNGGFPPARMVVHQVTERQRVQVGVNRWGDPNYEWKDVVVGRILGLPSDLAPHYPSGHIPSIDITYLQAQGVL